MRVLGIDYGERRIGLAISDPDGSFAMALRVVSVKSADEIVQAVRRACAETEAERVVVGLPVNMNGAMGPMADKVKAFADRLGAEVGLQVETSDERLSTCMAERTLLEADMSRKKRKGVRDKLSAQVILQGYLDRMKNESS